MLIVEFLALIAVSESGSATANNVFFGQGLSGFRLAAAVIEFREGLDELWNESMCMAFPIVSKL